MKILKNWSFRIDDFEGYKTYVLLTQSHLTYINDQKNLETVSLGEVTDLVINQEGVKSFAQMAKPFLKVVVPFLVVFTFLGVLVIFPAADLIYLLFYSLILWLISKIVNYPLVYKKAYQMALHLDVIWVALAGLLSLVSSLPDVPFLRTILLTLLGLAVLMKVRDLKPQSRPAKKAASE